MDFMSRFLIAVVFAFGVLTLDASAQSSLHEKIDQWIEARAKGTQFAPLADDEEFLRRASLDLLGRIPTREELAAFRKDANPLKREKWIDKALVSKAHARKMADFFHVHFMERLGDNPEWHAYLEQSFQANKPWNVMAGEILKGKRSAEDPSGAGFFLSKRLENYGQNPVDYSALARDVGRLFLGRDLRCAECHDHLFVEDYKQEDFKGLFAFFQNTFLVDAKSMVVGEKLTDKKLEYSSVFKKDKKETGPRVPGLKEVAIPAFAKGEEYAVAPDPKKKQRGIPKFSPLDTLATGLPDSKNPGFARNSVNRIWFLMMGRGLVHPLDLHHTGNPPSHPELLDLLASEFVAHHWDVRWLLSELAKSKTYQRSGRLAQKQIKPELFAVALEKRLSAEQLLVSMLVATGRWEKLERKNGAEPILPEALLLKFRKAFANAPREPEDEIQFSLQAALFLLNDASVLNFLEPEEGTLVFQLQKVNDDRKAIELAYEAVLSRKPSEMEMKDAQILMQKAGKEKFNLLVWGLLSSSEFCLNH